MNKGPVVTKEAKPRLPDIIKEESTSVTDKYARYLPSKEETTNIATLIEKHTGLKVNKDLKISFVKNSDEAVKLAVDGYLPTLNGLKSELKLEEKVYNDILKEITDTMSLWLKLGYGFYHPMTGKIYLISDALEDSIKKSSVNLVKNGIIQGKLKGVFSLKADERALDRTAKFIVLRGSCHESVHKTLAENNPTIRKEILRLMIKETKLSSELKTSSGDEREKIHKMLEQADSHAKAISTFNEAVAYYTESRIMRDLGFDGEESFFLKNIREQHPDIAKGIAFLEEIEKITHKNPILLIYKDLPISMHEIENPRAYLRRTRGWRV